MSKRTKLQCGGPAMQGKTKCKFHGGKSTGPVTELGRQICAAPKTVHGKDTRLDRQKYRLVLDVNYLDRSASIILTGGSGE